MRPPDGGLIAAWRQSCQSHRVRDEDGAFHTLGAHHRLEGVRGQMISVGDERGRKTIACKSRPKKIGMAWQLASQSIAEMGGQDSSRLGCGMNLSWVCISVADRRDTSSADKMSGVGQCPIIVGRERHHSYQIPAGRLPTL